MSTLAIDSLTIAASEPLLEQLELTISGGQRLGLIGESGSGKSITALSIMGLLPENLRASGSIDFEGQQLLGMDEKRLCALRGKRISMVFQEPMTALNPLMRVNKQLAEVISLHGGSPSKDRLKQMAAEIGLAEELLGRYPHQLSGGQRQRVLIAMALANDPDVLICDEPTTALDVTVQKDIVELISALVAERGTALLFITHDLGLVAQTCDNVAVLKDGILVETGPVDQVLRDPQHDYTKGLLAASDLSARDADGHLYTVASSQLAGYAPGVAQARPQWREVSRTDDDVVLRADRISKTYGRTLFGRSKQYTALHPMDLNLYRHQRLGVVGGSGSGKTTLLKLLAGLSEPTAGSVTAKGTVQAVFQDPFDSLDPRMTIGDAVAEPLRAQGINDPARVSEVLEEVGIDPALASRYPHEFSGGQRQRISIARALSVRPDILLADEPVSALDVSVRAQVMNLLTDLCIDYGLSMVFVSHDLGVVRELCQDVIVLDEGSIVEQGPVSRVLHNPDSPYTQRLLDAIPRITEV